MRSHHVLATLSLAILAPATSLTAQVLGLPVVNSGAPTGIALSADLGLPNDAAGNYTAIGASAGIGVGFVGVRAMVSRVDGKGAGDAVWAKGAAVSVRLFGGPLIPIRANLLGGWGHWNAGGASVTRYPISIGLAATIPNPALAIKPWIAPRVEMERVTVGGNTDSDSNFGISGGVDFSLLSGISFRAAYDRLFVKGNKPGILSFGIGYSL